MNTATVPGPRTAAALASRRRKTEAALERVHQAIARLRREKAQVSVAAVARRADVSRTFLYDNAEARAAVAASMAEAGERRTQMLADRDDEREATWRERALNAEDALKAAHTEILAQRTRTNKKNAASRRAALERATAAEADARRLHNTRAGAKWQAQLMTRRGVRQAVEHMAGEHGITSTGGLSITDRRWAGGTPLIGVDGVLVAVLAPESALVNGEAFRLLAGMLLLFLTVKDQQRFDRNTRRRRKVPIDGWRMAYIETPAPKPAEKAAPKAAVPRCQRAGGPCTCPEPDLSVTISGRPHSSEPADCMTPAAALYTALCSTCGGPYDKPWRRRTA
ncbi:DUF6262 family protein [Streptomyces sindenensis]|uniref:DUF6262 family protein n=1 Tax=Streptomyces sindenensis TaxID=67363 RepID=UPI0019C66525|nr:DUF6262 family protein [Streptomyces sindenensis]GGP87070.1 hypothetical protein GCM10010231_66450 [Streptomyces sindenensis]